MILGPGHFISHWTWTVAFGVFLFLGLVGESRGSVERVPGAGDTRRGSQPSARCGPACCTRCEYECPALRLLQRAPKVMLGDGFCALFRCLCKIWQTTQVSGNFRDNKRLGRLMSFPPSEDIQMDLGFKASREIIFREFPWLQRVKAASGWDHTCRGKSSQTFFSFFF